MGALSGRRVDTAHRLHLSVSTRAANEPSNEVFTIPEKAPTIVIESAY